MSVASQLAMIKAEVWHAGDHIVFMLESKVVEARLVVASMMRMETALGEDVCTAIATTKCLVKYLKQEGQ